MDTRMVIAAYFRHAGWEVVPTGAISKAKEKLKACRIDVTLSDVHLPDGKGWDLLTEPRSHKAVFIVSMSAHPRAEVEAKCKAVGFQ